MTTTSTHPTVTQNAAHRADLTWFKAGKSEYMRADGVTIKRDCMTAQWNVYLADGTRAPYTMSDGRTLEGVYMSGHSLTAAKYEASQIS